MKSKFRSNMLVLLNCMSVVSGIVKSDCWKRSSCQSIAMKSSVSINIVSKIGCVSLIGGLATYDGGDSCLFLAGFVCSESDDEGFEVLDDVDVCVSFRDEAGGFPILLDSL